MIASVTFNIYINRSATKAALLVPSPPSLSLGRWAADN